MSSTVASLFDSFSHLASAATEPLWLLGWGALLIGISAGLRNRSRRRALSRAQATSRAAKPISTSVPVHGHG
jgi:hypothetical protein